MILNITNIGLLTNIGLNTMLRNYYVINNNITTDYTSFYDFLGTGISTFPRINRISSRLMSFDLVSVQPMEVPLNPVFYTEFDYDIPDSVNFYMKMRIPLNGLNVLSSRFFNNNSDRIGINLRARWTPELEQDINAFRNIDAEGVLTSILSENLAGEIDRMILANIRGLTNDKPRLSPIISTLLSFTPQMSWVVN